MAEEMQQRGGSYRECVYACMECVGPELVKATRTFGYLVMIAATSMLIAASMREALIAGTLTERQARDLFRRMYAEAYRPQRRPPRSPSGISHWHRAAALLSALALLLLTGCGGIQGTGALP
jgi:hypothetical protein